MFRIPKINYLDPDVFNIHRGKILTRYDEEIHDYMPIQEVNYGRSPESLKIYNIVYGRAYKKNRILNYHSHVSASSCPIFKDVVVSFVSHGMGTGHIARCLKK